MRAGRVVIGIAVVGGLGAMLTRRVAARPSAPAAEPRSRWHSVTIVGDASSIMTGGAVPEPLAELGDLVDVEAREAPGDKGTELRARLRHPEPSTAAWQTFLRPGEDPRRTVRAALRRTKQLIEVGEVLRVDPTPHGTRKATPTGVIVESATKRAAGEGLL